MTVFGDEILARDSSAEYGEGDEKDWVMYSYNTENNTYDLLGAEEPIQTDKGYWIIQLIANEITVSLPEESVVADGSHADMLAAELGCAPGQLIRGVESQAWECAGPTRVERSCEWTAAEMYDQYNPYDEGNTNPYCSVTCPSGVVIYADATGSIPVFKYSDYDRLDSQSYAYGAGTDTVDIYVESRVAWELQVDQYITFSGEDRLSPSNATYVVEAVAVCL